MSFCIKVIFLLIFQHLPASHAKYRTGDDITDPCFELVRESQHLEQALSCCEVMKKAFEPMYNDYNEHCLDIEPEEWSCLRFRCLLTPVPGILIKKWDVDPFMGLEMLAKITAKYPELERMTKKLGHECFVKNLTQFYDFHNCPAANMMNCLAKHSFADCPSWRNSAECHSLAKGAELCKPKMDEYDNITERLHNYKPTTKPVTIPDTYDPSDKSCGAVHLKYRNLEVAKECCPAMKQIFEPIDQNEDVCIDIESQKWNCQKFMCLMRTGWPGLLMKNLDINKEKGHEMMEHISNSNTELTPFTELLDHECFVKNVTQFYFLEKCPPMNLMYCLAANMLAECPEWNDDEICKPLEEPAKNCKQFLDSYRKVTDNVHYGRVTTLPPEPTAPTLQPAFESCGSMNSDYNLLEHTKKCCEGMQNVFELIDNNRDCAAITPGKWSCKKTQCLFGSPVPDLLTEEIQVNMEKARKILHQIAEEHPKLERMTRMIEHECIDKNVTRYYPFGDTNCPVMNFHYCWAMNSFVECPKWSKTPQCKSTEEWGKKCHDTVAEIRHNTNVIEKGIMATQKTIIYTDTMTSPMPKDFLCSRLISDFSYVEAAQYCCYPMRKIFMSTFHIDRLCLRVTHGRWSCEKAQCLLNAIPGLLVDKWYVNANIGKKLLKDIASKYSRTVPMTRMMYHECIEKNATQFYPVEP